MAKKGKPSLPPEARAFFAKARKDAWDKLSPEERKNFGKKASPWKNMTKAQRSREMKRRAKVREARRRQEASAKGEHKA
jgi:hypothetical protein